ncbi:MAG TPA: glycosyltransferase [Puia sp.]|nr:glycosyltransferase [Puia sp.]
MLFSVLMANYNNSGYLAEAIRSVMAQDHADWELILVDDASTDDFEGAVASFRAEKRIRIFRNQRNYGCGYSKAKCVEKASGAILGFLDPDDALTPDALSIMVAAHVDNPGCSLIHSTHYICDGSLSVSRIAEYPRPLPDGVPYLLVSDGRIHHFASFSRSHYDITEGISPLNRRAVDQDLYYKLEEAGGILFIDKPLYYYRIHDRSISNSGNESAAQLCHYSIIEEACLRRMRAGRSGQMPEKGFLKRYRTRYFKIRLFHSFRQRRWLSFIRNFIAFSVMGGMGNLLSYLRKLPLEGRSLLRRSFSDSYKIRV